MHFLILTIFCIFSLFITLGSTYGKTEEELEYIFENADHLLGGKPGFTIRPALRKSKYNERNEGKNLLSKRKYLLGGKTGFEIRTTEPTTKAENTTVLDQEGLAVSRENE